MKLYLLAVGINNYTAGVKRLSHCINDATSWYRILDTHYSHLIEEKILLTKFRETNAENILKEFKIFLEAAMLI